jgi:signal transduction histidine kinase
MFDLLVRSLFLPVLITFLFTFEAHSQNNSKNIDSLNKRASELLSIDLSKTESLASEAQTKSITSNYQKGRIESELILSMVYANTNRGNNAIQVLSDLIATYDSQKDSSFAGKISSAIGLCYYYLGIYDSSKKYLQQSALAFEKSNDKFLLAEQFQFLSKLFLRTGETKKSQEYYEKARNIFEDLKSANGLAWADDIFGEILYAQRLYEKANESHLKSLIQFERLNNLAGQASAVLHIGNTYYMLVQDDSAEICYNKALNFYQQLGDSNGIAICYSNLSMVALEKGENTAAVNYANQALHSITGGGYLQIEISTLRQLGDIYAEMKQYDKAVYHVKKALDAALKSNMKVKVMDCYKSLSEIYITLNNPKQSYDYLLMAYRIKDSIQPIAFSQKLAELENQLENQKRESQIQELKQGQLISALEIENQKSEIRKRNLLIISGMLFFILMGTVVYFYFQKQKLKSKLEKELTIQSTAENERLRFAKDIHDDLGSGLSKINFLSELMLNHSKTNADVSSNAAAISETSKRLIGNMRDLIWALNPENTTTGDLIAAIREFTSDYLEDFTAELQLNIPANFPDFQIRKECYREVLMTVKESLNNIVKHSAASEIQLGITLNDNDLIINVSDNGIGLTEGKDKSGNGLTNMQARIAAIGGVFSLKSEPNSGTSIRITVPVSQLSKT